MEKGVLSTEPVVICETLTITPVTVMVNGELMGYVMNLEISDKGVKVQRCIPDGHGGFNAITQVLKLKG